MPKAEPRQLVLPFWVPQNPSFEVRSTGAAVLVAEVLARTGLETERETEPAAGAALVTVQLPKPGWHPVPQWPSVVPQ